MIVLLVKFMGLGVVTAVVTDIDILSLPKFEVFNFGVIGNSVFVDATSLVTDATTTPAGNEADPVDTMF